MDRAERAQPALEHTSPTPYNDHKPHVNTRSNTFMYHKCVREPAHTRRATLTPHSTDDVYRLEESYASRLR